MNAFGGAVVVEDEVSGFRYFDARDLLGFVDGTANPTGAEITDAAWITDESDPDFGGGAYVVVQKYVHDLDAWGALTVEQQEAVIGRTKVENIELDDDPDAPAHKTLTTIEDPQTGEELDIIRDNMPFGRPGAGEYGTYFIGYASRLWVIETMLQRMFLGDRPGRYDRILDFSTAVTGTTFFVPTPDVLEGLADETPAPPRRRRRRLRPPRPRRRRHRRPRDRLAARLVPDAAQASAPKRSSSASQTSALPSDGARQSPRGDSEPPAATFGPFGSAERLNCANAKKRRQKTSSQRRISGRS